VRTSVDMARMVPFAFFIIVPFMELALPVFLYLFPNMLPSTFTDALQEEEKLKQKLRVKLEMAKFLQETTVELAKTQAIEGGEHRATALELSAFMTRVRSGAFVANEELMKFAPLFRDEVTLDSFSRRQLEALCHLLGLSVSGPEAMLLYRLRSAIHKIKLDDRDILAEGVTSLNKEELKEACRQRGIRAIGISERNMQFQLTQWLDLSLHKNMPLTLLLLSRAFSLHLNREDARFQAEQIEKTGLMLLSTLADLPDKTIQDVGVKESKASEPVQAPSLAAKIEAKERELALLEREEKLIKEERQKIVDVQQYIVENPSEAKAPVTVQAVAKAQQVEIVVGGGGGGAGAGGSGEAPAASSSGEPKGKAGEPVAKPDVLKWKQVSQAIATLTSRSAVDLEKAILAQLRKKVDKVVSDDGAGKAAAAAAAAAAASVAASDATTAATTAAAAAAAATTAGAAAAAAEPAVVAEDAVTASKLTRKVNDMVAEIEKELKAVEEKIGDKMHVLDRDCDGLITVAEVVQALDMLQTGVPKEAIIKLVAEMDIDGDGLISVKELEASATSLEEMADFEEVEIKEEEVSAKQQQKK
jgi:LETM1 and EF-hand domain-containing protein 1